MGNKLEEKIKKFGWDSFVRMAKKMFGKPQAQLEVPTVEEKPTRTDVHVGRKPSPAERAHR